MYLIKKNTVDGMTYLRLEHGVAVFTFERKEATLFRNERLAAAIAGVYGSETDPDFGPIAGKAFVEEVNDE